jgi:mobilization protein NikA
MRDQIFKFRVSEEERAALMEGAARYGVTPTTFIRRAIDAAVTQQPVLSLDERIAIDTSRDQFRRAAQNLDSLLRQVYLFQSGVMDRGPSEEDFRFMLSQLRHSAEALKAKLRKLP